MKKYTNNRSLVAVGLFLVSALVTLLVIAVIERVEAPKPQPTVPTPSVSAIPRYSYKVEDSKTEPTEEQAGSLCVLVKDIEGNPSSGCHIDFAQLRDDPKPGLSKADGCGVKGDYYFKSIPNGQYNIAVTCPGKQTASAPLEVYGPTSSTFMVPDSMTEGEVQVTQLGFALGTHFSGRCSEDRPDCLTLSLADALCIAGKDNQCKPLTPAQLKNVELTIPAECEGLLRKEGDVLKTDKASTASHQRCVIEAVYKKTAVLSFVVSLRDDWAD